MGPGGISHDRDVRRVDPVFGGVACDPAERAFQIADLVPPALRRVEPVIDVEDVKAEPVQPAIPLPEIAAAPAGPGAAMHPDHRRPRRVAGGALGSPDIQLQARTVGGGAVNQALSGLSAAKIYARG